MTTVFESVKIILHFGQFISEFLGETSDNYCILCSMSLFINIQICYTFFIFE